MLQEEESDVPPPRSKDIMTTAPKICITKIQKVMVGGALVRGIFGFNVLIRSYKGRILLKWEAFEMSKDEQSTVS